MSQSNSKTKSRKPNAQPSSEGGPEPAPEAGPRKTPRLRTERKAEADRKEPKKPPRDKRQPEEDLVVFAFRLTPDEREAIHKAAGPAKASRFVRTLAVAAALKDKAAVNELIAAIA